MFEKLYEALSHLPVMGIAHEIATSVRDGLIVILNSATGSGKTLVATCKLADMVGEQVVVCVPRRFLAVNAAETICELAGLTIGKEVGYAVGKQSGEQSMMSAETRLLFVTHGYAISSGLVNKARYFANDEVHEASMDISIVRALLLRRLGRGEDVKLMEMSATIDPVRQAAYWQLECPTKIYKIDGRTFNCIRSEVPIGNGIELQNEGEAADEEAFLDMQEREALENAREAVVAHEVVSLITNHNRKGVLVFRPGVGEVEETAKAITALAKRTLRQLCKQARRDNKHLSEDEINEIVVRIRESHPLANLEVAMIFGEMDYTTRKAAVMAPAHGRVKVLVGTNVVESGANIPWLDSGVTCGSGKQVVVRESGALSLELVNLSQWRLEQQEGRVKRFCDGMFVLCSDEPWKDRLEETSPEIIRLPLTELVMHCATFGVRAHSLRFDYAPDIQKIEDAEAKLQSLGLIDQLCNLTEAGRWISNLPVSTETGAMLWHAKQIGVLGVAVSLAAVMEVGGVRKDFKYPHGFSMTSDWLDSMIAFCSASEVFGEERRNFMELKNIGYKRFTAAKEVERDLNQRLKEEKLDGHWNNFGMDVLLRHCILAGQVNNVMINRDMLYTKEGVGYRCGHGSAVYNINTPLVCAGLRRIVPRNGNEPFTIVEKVTQITFDDVMAVARVRKELLVVIKNIDPRENLLGQRVSTTEHWFNGMLIRNEVVKATDLAWQYEAVHYGGQRIETKPVLAQAKPETVLPALVTPAIEMAKPSPEIATPASTDKLAALSARFRR